jgi:mitochondrial distribution and morphology protein 31
LSNLFTSPVHYPHLFLNLDIFEGDFVHLSLVGVILSVDRHHVAGMMAKGIPSVFSGRRLGISITNAESFTSFRVFASTHPRWLSINPAQPAPIEVVARRYLHVKTGSQLQNRINRQIPSAISFRNVVSRYPNSGYNGGTKERGGVQSIIKQQSSISPWTHQQRHYGTDGKESRCECGKEVRVPPLPAKTPNVSDKSTKEPSKEAIDPNKPVSPDLESESYAASVSKYLHLPHLPHMPHRPTKQELLAAANGFWSRIQVRLKWITIRSMRPWNADEWGAFVSWFMLGHLAWILLGTTTFVSLLIFSINTVFAQGTSTLGSFMIYPG